MHTNNLLKILLNGVYIRTTLFIVFKLCVDRVLIVTGYFVFKKQALIGLLKFIGIHTKLF